MDIIKTGDFVPNKGILIWHDEFEGDSLDLNKWNYDYGSGSQYGLDGWGNNEKQWYKPENVRVADGKLIIQAAMGGPGSSFPFTSGKITTGATLGSANQSDVTLNQVFPPKDFLGITTGYVEARIKAPKGRGFWPAFWLLGANTNEHNGFPLIGWPQCGEIDIMESAGGQEHLIHQTIHYGQGPFDYSRKWQKGTSYTINPSASDDYHIYGVGWESCGNTGGNTGQLRFYFNDELKFTQNFPLPEGERANSESFFDDVPFFIIFNLAIGGNFLPETDRNYLQSSTFTNPDWETRSLMVDWVRVYSGSKNAGDDGSF